MTVKMKGKAAIIKLIPVKLHIFPRYRSRHFNRRRLRRRRTARSPPAVKSPL